MGSDPASAARGTPDFEAPLYGQAAALNRALPAAEPVALLVAEALAIFEAREPAGARPGRPTGSGRPISGTAAPRRPRRAAQARHRIKSTDG